MRRDGAFTGLGDALNTTARLASIAAAGELLVSTAASDRAGFDGSGYEHRMVEVRGRESGLEVYSIRSTLAAP